MSTLSLRPGTLDDDEITLALFQRAVREVASRDYTPAQIEAWIDNITLPAWAAVNARRRMWIAMLDDTPAGFADLTEKGHLDRLFVSPDYQRCGVASALLALVEQAARQRGMTRLTTDASLTALSFFEARGFVVTWARQVERRGEVLDNFQMEKCLEGYRSVRRMLNCGLKLERVSGEKQEGGITEQEPGTGPARTDQI